MGILVAFLLLLALGILCIVAVFVARVLLPNSSPVNLPSFVTWTPSPVFTSLPAQPTSPPSPTAGPSTEADVSINPDQGYINTLITVTGQGMWPGEPVFVFLRSKEEGEGRGFAYAAAVADDEGHFRTGLTFPNEMRWLGEQWADVIVRGTRSEREAITRFMLIEPTPTHTPPPPTPRPTLAPTNTPLPTATPLPTNTPTPSPTTEVIITDWRGEYYANMALTGELALTRNDEVVAFNWGEGSPGEGVPADGFSARWTRFLHFGEGAYRFTVAVDDGARFWIDGRLLVDEWHDSSLATYEFDYYLDEGNHALQLEYYENVGGAMIQLRWTPLGQTTPTSEASPTDVPYPTATPTPSLSDSWRGEYYDNPFLDGMAVMVRQDVGLNFNWGEGSPGQTVPPDNFSARWTREVWLSAGTYRFSLQMDDGARFWLDGQLLIDAWPADIGQTYALQIDVAEGAHILKIEYFEATGGARLRFWAERIP